MSQYESLPRELRFMLIDNMDSEDKCRFRQVSTACNNEVKATKNYIHALHFTFSETDLYIQIDHDDMSNGFVLHFKNDDGKKYLIYRNLDNKECWRENLNAGTDLLHFATDHFQDLLTKHQNTVRRLRINSEISIGFETSIKHFNHLETLELYGEQDIMYFFSRLRRPLKKLCVKGKSNSAILQDRPELYQVEKELWIKTELSYQQLMALDASIVTMDIGDLTEEELSSFVQSWQNGTIGQNIESYSWILHGSYFDTRKLAKLLVIDRHVLESEGVRIKSYSGTEGLNILRCRNSVLQFFNPSDSTYEQNVEP